MKIIHKREFELLKKAGFIIMDGEYKNCTVINRQKSSKRKKYAIVYDWKDKNFYHAVNLLLSGKNIPEKLKNTNS